MLQRGIELQSLSSSWYGSGIDNTSATNSSVNFYDGHVYIPGLISRIPDLVMHEVMGMRLYTYIGIRYTFPLEY